eukprot:GHVP01065920.1.p1 GENE.GHVP01065920.1~~GHVP01065920.1.p1  ORF type:complete len:1128 (+),score=222.41 GHVP01065920.1:449-3385(+)
MGEYGDLFSQLVAILKRSVSSHKGAAVDLEIQKTAIAASNALSLISVIISEINSPHYNRILLSLEEHRNIHSWFVVFPAFNELVDFIFEEIGFLCGDKKSKIELLNILRLLQCVVEFRYASPTDLVFTDNRPLSPPPNRWSILQRIPSIAHDLLILHSTPNLGAEHRQSIRSIILRLCSTVVSPNPSVTATQREQLVLSYRVSLVGTIFEHLSNCALMTETNSTDVVEEVLHVTNCLRCLFENHEEASLVLLLDLNEEMITLLTNAFSKICFLISNDESLIFAVQNIFHVFESWIQLISKKGNEGQKKDNVKRLITFGAGQMTANVVSRNLEIFLVSEGDDKGIEDPIDRGIKGQLAQSSLSFSEYKIPKRMQKIPNHLESAHELYWVFGRIASFSPVVASSVFLKHMEQVRIKIKNYNQPTSPGNLQTLEWEHFQDYLAALYTSFGYFISDIKRSEMVPLSASVPNEIFWMLHSKESNSLNNLFDVFFGIVKDNLQSIMVQSPTVIWSWLLATIRLIETYKNAPNLINIDFNGLTIDLLQICFQERYEEQVCSLAAACLLRLSKINQPGRFELTKVSTYVDVFARPSDGLFACCHLRSLKPLVISSIPEHTMGKYEHIKNFVELIRKNISGIETDQNPVFLERFLICEAALLQGTNDFSLISYLPTPTDLSVVSARFKAYPNIVAQCLKVLHKFSLHLFVFPQQQQMDIINCLIKISKTISTLSDDEDSIRLSGYSIKVANQLFQDFELNKPKNDDQFVALVGEIFFIFSHLKKQWISEAFWTLPVSLKFLRILSSLFESFPLESIILCDKNGISIETIILKAAKNSLTKGNTSALNSVAEILRAIIFEADPRRNCVSQFPRILFPIGTIEIVANILMVEKSSIVHREVVGYILFIFCKNSAENSEKQNFIVSLVRELCKSSSVDGMEMFQTLEKVFIFVNEFQMSESSGTPKNTRFFKELDERLEKVVLFLQNRGL